MKLYYFRSKTGNFGDDLNPWFWHRIFPGVFDDSADALFVGIGTILNDKLPKSPRYLVMGSGYGYGGRPPLDDADWQIWCVRGPRTARELGLDPGLAVADPAIKLPELVAGEPASPPDGRVACGFMPHHTSATHGRWQDVCALADIEFVDPREDVHTVASKIRACDLLIAEAMHGAIVADAFRVPWICAQSHSDFCRFKWLDWADSLEIPLEAHFLPATWAGNTHLPVGGRAKIAVKRVVRRLGGELPGSTPPPPIPSSPREIETAARLLAGLRTDARPQLSDEARLKRRSEQLDDIFHKFARENRERH